MRVGILAEKLGMSRYFDKNSSNQAVTLLKVTNCKVISIQSKDKNGYDSVTLSHGKSKKPNKPFKSFLKKNNLKSFLRSKEFRVDSTESFRVGDEINVTNFVVGQYVDVSSNSIGKGFAGGMKRHNFAGLEATHGVSISHRSHGSTGNSQDPGRVWKGKKMAGQYGNVNKTIQNLTVIQINDVENLLYVKGSVPGPKNGYLTVRDAIKSKLPENVLKPAGLKDNNESIKDVSDQKEIVQDAETKSNSENVEVKNEEPNDQRATEQTVSNSDVSSNAVITDANKDIKDKED